MSKLHSFHIPVLGLSFSVDTPYKVSGYGIDSVISLADDSLIEQMRELYCKKFLIPYREITKKSEDSRARRITAYLNMINDLSEKKFEELKNSFSRKSGELRDFFSMLPDDAFKKEFEVLAEKTTELKDLLNWIKSRLSMGSIDVNIMTKLDKENYKGNQKLSLIYNDAHAALRGYANSNLTSSVVLSAGMNPKLYSYIENFADFYPDRNGKIKKKITLKVSDYRSALIQGKFLAKKGLWVSEFRIESGLNCGGHAFATDGHLLGPILNEFKLRRRELKETLRFLFMQALSDKHLAIPVNEPELRITAQGGVGTAEEHRFLIDHYRLDSVGWGTPFLLVPEAIRIDKQSLNKLSAAREKDLYLSTISPLGIPFNNLRGNSQDIIKENRIRDGKPGSPCPKGFLSFSREFTSETICTASRKYQNLKINQIRQENLSPGIYHEEIKKVTEKACLCVGLSNSVNVGNRNGSTDNRGGISICPGPNMAYFSRTMSLREITDHIYGRINVITRIDRPNMFVKELKIYIDYLQNKINEKKNSLTIKQIAQLSEFEKNIDEGIDYYYQLFSDVKNVFESKRANIFNSLEKYRAKLNLLSTEIKSLYNKVSIA